MTKYFDTLRYRETRKKRKLAGIKARFCEQHGFTGTPEYIAYKHARKHCQNPLDAKFRIYGGRGIKFLFISFKQFLTEIGLRPSPKHSLDRIDNDGHYEPGNVRWATKKEQVDNRRNRWREEKICEEVGC